MATRRKAKVEVTEQPEQPQEEQASSKRLRKTSSTNVFKEIIRYTFILLIGGMFLSRMLTERWIPYEGKWVKWKTYFPVRLFTPLFRL
jgi:hypothetical protein